MCDGCLTLGGSGADPDEIDYIRQPLFSEDILFYPTPITSNVSDSILCKHGWLLCWRCMLEYKTFSFVDEQEFSSQLDRFRTLFNLEARMLNSKGFNKHLMSNSNFVIASVE